MLKLSLIVLSLIMFSNVAFANKIFSDGSQEINSGNTTHYYGSDGGYEGSSYKS